MTDSLTWQLVMCFLRVGAASFGGASSGIALMQRELVGAALLTPQEFTEALALSTTVPGLVVANMAVYVSFKLGGSYGTAAAAVSACMLPAVFLMGGATYLLMKYQDLKALPSMLRAVQPLLVSMLTVTLIGVVPVGLVSIYQWIVFAGTIVLAAVFKVHPGWIVLGAGAIGAIFRPG
jgi:chromate transporter